MKFLWNKRSVFTTSGLDNYIMYRKLMRTIKKESPTFGVLWQISDFIKCLEQTYFYENDPMKNGISSTDQTQSDQNGFRINTNEFRIDCKLCIKNERVILNLTGFHGNKKEIRFEFANGEWISDHDEHTDIQLNSTISIIWAEVLGILSYYYDRTDIYGCYMHKPSRYGKHYRLPKFKDNIS